MKAIKKPIEVEVEILKEDIVIHTIEGDMLGKKGDYLITGIEGEKYPCKKEIFEKTYKIIEEENSIKEITNNFAFWNQEQEKWMNIRQILNKNVKLYKKDKYYYLFNNKNIKIYKHLTYKGVLK